MTTIEDLRTILIAVETTAKKEIPVPVQLINGIDDMPTEFTNTDNSIVVGLDHGGDTGIATAFVKSVADNREL